MARCQNATKWPAATPYSGSQQPEARTAELLAQLPVRSGEGVLLSSSRFVSRGASIPKFKRYPAPPRGTAFTAAARKIVLRD